VDARWRPYFSAEGPAQVSGGAIAVRLLFRTREAHRLVRSLEPMGPSCRGRTQHRQIGRASTGGTARGPAQPGCLIHTKPRKTVSREPLPLHGPKNCHRNSVARSLGKCCAASTSRCQVRRSSYRTRTKTGVCWDLRSCGYREAAAVDKAVDNCGDKVQAELWPGGKVARHLMRPPATFPVQRNAETVPHVSRGTNTGRDERPSKKFRAPAQHLSLSSLPNNLWAGR
jgi:hypothetical protein